MKSFVCTAGLLIGTGIALASCDRPSDSVSRVDTTAASVAQSAAVQAMPVRARPAPACFAPESLVAAPLVFGNLRLAEGGGYDGMEFQFVPLDSGIGASIRRASGGDLSIAPVESLRYEPVRDSLTLWMTQYGATQYSYQFAPRCDALLGFARYSRDVVRLSLPRVVNPLVDNSPSPITLGLIRRDSADYAPWIVETVVAPFGQEMASAPAGAGHWRLVVARQDGSLSLFLEQVSFGEAGCCMEVQLMRQIALDSVAIRFDIGPSFSDIWNVEAASPRGFRFLLGGVPLYVEVLSRDSVRIYWERIEH